MKHLLIGLLFMGCAQDNSEITAVLERNTEALKSVSVSGPEQIVVDYQIVKTSNADKLVEEVKTLMSEGWQPLGGHDLEFQALHDSRLAKFHIFRYQQTMVKYGTIENGDEPK